MKKPELLSPVGNKECLIAAIEAGCDAVYLGGKTFGARNYAGNFSDNELIEAIKYAHLYGVKVYVTVNTIIYEEETEDFIKFIDFLHKNNVDAIIIQDIGMIDYLRKTYPNLEIHASTQMNIHNIEGAKLLEELGLKRVVLARETDIDTVKKIKENTNIEIELFVQGALCFSYSGQCLMSSLIGGRSGNRGTCTQCCRMPYDLISNKEKINKDNYLLSTKDLNVIEHIEELIELGIDSFKIEGRMKRPEYVYLMTSIYRKAIDNCLNKKYPIVTKEDIKEMKKLFNREFTKGFLFNEKNNNFLNTFRPNHMGIKIGNVIKTNPIKIKLTENIIQGDGIRIIGKKDVGCILNKIKKNGKLINHALKGDIVEIDLKEPVSIGDIVVKTSDKLQLDKIEENINKKRKINIIGKIICKYNEPIKLIFNDYKNEVVIESNNLIEKAIKGGTSKERIIEQIKKLGDSIYKLEKLDCDIDDNIFIPISELNEIRRKAVEELNKKRLYEIPYKKEKYYIEIPNFKKEKNYSVLVKTKEDYEQIKNKKLENIYLENPLYNEIDDSRKILKLPRINFNVKENKNILIGDFGNLYKNKNVITDFGFNITNSYSVAFLHSIGVNKITLSYELTDKQIENIINKYHERYNKHPNLELIISSYPESMISKYSIFDFYNIKSGYIKDKLNRKYELKEKDNILTIYHYEKIERNFNYFNLGINSLRIHIEDKEDIKKIP